MIELEFKKTKYGLELYQCPIHKRNIIIVSELKKNTLQQAWPEIADEIIKFYPIHPLKVQFVQHREGTYDFVRMKWDMDNLTHRDPVWVHMDKVNLPEEYKKNL
jgi:hypothetical protein